MPVRLPLQKGLKLVYLAFNNQLPRPLVLLCTLAASQEADQQCAGPSDSASDAAEAAACSAEPLPTEQAAAADLQLEGLLQIKAVLDAGGVLTQWTRQTGREQGYCRCDLDTHDVPGPMAASA